MISLTADDKRLLKDVRLYIDPVEIYDPAGKLLGLFVPANLERAKEIRAKVEAQIDWAEIERRKQSKEPGIPHELVLARIGMLDAEIKRRKAAGEREWTTEEAMAFFRSLGQNGVGQSLPSGQPTAGRESGGCDTP